MSEIRKNSIVSRLTGGKVAGSSCHVFTWNESFKSDGLVFIERIFTFNYCEASLWIIYCAYNFVEARDGNINIRYQLVSII